MRPSRTVNSGRNFQLDADFFVREAVNVNHDFQILFDMNHPQKNSWSELVLVRTNESVEIIKAQHNGERRRTGGEGGPRCAGLAGVLH